MIIRKVYCILSFILISITTFGQNYGLTSPQAPETLPKSLAPSQHPVWKEKANIKTRLIPIGDQEWMIRDGWELTEASKVISSKQSIFNKDLNTSNWYNATVPGTVLTTLVDQGIYPDPYWGINNLSIPDTLCRMDWWYRTKLILPKANFQPENISLLFKGINYKAEVWLNGRLIGNINGAFCRGEFNVTNLIDRVGDNILAVHILPPPNPGIPHEQSPTSGRGPNGGQLCMDGPTFISSEGWDWVPGIRDRNIGIWQDVILQYKGDVSLNDPQIITDLPLPDTTSAQITIKTELRNHSGELKKIQVVGTIEGISFHQSIELNPHEVTTIKFSPEKFSQLKIINPRLWWPNGYGNPELYNLKLTVLNPDGTTSDNKIIRFGIRELSYNLTVSAADKKNQRIEFNPIAALIGGKPLFDNINRTDVGEGVNIPKLLDGTDSRLLPEISDEITSPYLVVKVNGQRIFCKGGNWGMDDAMKRVSREHLEPYFKLHHDAHFNMVRNWTGESTEEVFYELCDEYGLMVWNDFWLSTEGYNLNVNNDNLFLENVTDVVHRYRNHASIVIWCPRNEGYAPKYLEEGISSILASEDPTRYYQPNSRYTNLRPSGPWHFFKDNADYFRNNAKGFNTELGTPSIPTASSMRKMMDNKDLWPISDVWFYHDLHFGQKEYIEAIDLLYGKSNNLDDFCKKAQLINYESHRAMFESWNSKLWNNTSGLLLWMTHPAWPSTVWQVYSWDYETPGSYFGSKKACEPVHVQMNLHDNQIIVVNTSLKEFSKAEVSLEIYNLFGKVIFEKNQITNIYSNRLNQCFTPEIPATLSGVYLTRLTLKSNQGEIISTNEYWKNASAKNDFSEFNQLQNIRLKVKILKIQKGKQTKVDFEISNPTKTPAIGIKLNLLDTQNNEVHLPAYFSDGYFTLMQNEKRHLSVVYDGNNPVTIACEGYNINSTQNSK